MGKLAAPVRADKEMMFTNRQLVALHSTLGMRKTDVMASRILDINPAAARAASGHHGGTC